MMPMRLESHSDNCRESVVRSSLNGRARRSPSEKPMSFEYGSDAAIVEILSIGRKEICSNKKVHGLEALPAVQNDPGTAN